MSCSPFDLRDYFLKELTDPQQRQVEAHVKTCQPCREEMERLRITEAALFSLREEEIPQRIGFVSDKIFEPSPWQRWWSSFWGSAARLGFASAAMLSIAVVVFSLTRPAPAPVTNVTPPATATTTTAVKAPESDIEQRVQAAVERALASSEQRRVQETRALTAELEQTRQRLLWAAQEFDLSQKRARVGRVVASNYGPPQENGEMK
jgi:anti-sigma factor RsiW